MAFWTACLGYSLVDGTSKGPNIMCTRVKCQFKDTLTQVSGIKSALHRVRDHGPSCVGHEKAQSHNLPLLRNGSTTAGIADRCQLTLHCGSTEDRLNLADLTPQWEPGKLSQVLTMHSCTTTDLGLGTKLKWISWMMAPAKCSQ